MRSALLFVALALFAAVAVQAQAPIPYRSDGWQISGPLTAPIVIDGFVDLLCPDCAAAWPTIKQLVAYYGDKLAFNLHTFPLPYHTYGFTAAQAAHAAVSGGAGPAAVSDFFFGAQAAYWNDATANQSSSQVVAALGAQMVAAKLTTPAAFTAGMSNANINEETRVSWKYACSRGVLGTPSFFVNGVALAADPSWTLAEWRSVLDTLLAPQAKQAVAAEKKAAPAVVATGRKHRSVRRHAAAAAGSSGFLPAHSAATCDPTYSPCAYTPGKTECCSGMERCIPDVGCRVIGESAPAISESAPVSSRRFLPAHSAATCDPTYSPCAYTPGKTECCSGMERCIPDVGCRVIG